MIKHPAAAWELITSAAARLAAAAPHGGGALHRLRVAWPCQAALLFALMPAEHGDCASGRHCLDCSWSQPCKAGSCPDGTAPQQQFCRGCGREHHVNKLAVQTCWHTARTCRRHAAMACRLWCAAPTHCRRRHAAARWAGRLLLWQAGSACVLLHTAALCSHFKGPALQNACRGGRPDSSRPLGASRRPGGAQSQLRQQPRGVGR